MSRTTGTLEADAGLKAGASGTILTDIRKGTVSVIVAALAAAAEADVSVTITGAVAGDYVSVTPTNAAMETGLSISGAFVTSADTVSIRMSNQSTGSLTGSTENWTYILMKS